MENKHPRKILKSPVAKRRSRLIPKDQKVTLERVLGFTVTSNATLACDPNTGTLAYPAGCVVVLYSPKKNKQGHIFNVSKKTITSLAFSGDGKHLVTGESGHQPAVRIWDVAEKTQVAEFLGHKFGINCVAFSPNLKYMVSIGTQHDMQVNVWNWRTGSKVASNKVSSKVTAVAFSSDGSYFVTAGMRHVKFWYLDSSKSKINATVPLNGRNGILGEHRNNFFCDVATGIGRQDKNTFCITQSGSLCQFNEKRQMDKWVELRTSCATCISAADDYLVVGCANGIVRVFDADSLHFIASLPRPHYLGVDIADAVNPSQIGPAKTDDIKYPDTIAIKFDENHRKVTCLYNDHSMYVWDVHDLKKIGKAWSFLYHSSCVYGVETYPMLENGRPSILPPNSFFTCSSDDTIRIWNLDPHMPETASYKSNIYSHDLLKVMYMDPSLASLCDVDYNPSGATDKTDTNYDDKNGIRSIRVSPDGQHLASGDRQGNVRIHELEKLIEIKQIEAHESEVLCLEYSHWKTGPKILASSSRDRLIHVFDAEQQYGLLQTLSDHSSSISAVKFTETDGNMKMISCGADKSILFRNLQQDPEFQFTLATHQVEKTTLYDMDVEPTHNFTAIACQDRNVRIYNIKNGKKKKEYKGSLSDDGTLLKMKLDPSGSYAATSSSDKNLCILDFYTGELCATMFGHSEIATDVRFMNDLRHLISTGGDGCIFVWRLPKEMTSQMQSRLADMGHDVPMTNGVPKLDDIPSLKDDVDFGVPPEREFFSPESVLKKMYSSQQQPARQLTPEEDPSYRFSISQLPSWAKKQFSEDEASTKAEEEGTVAAPRGRWAQRAEGQSLTVKQQDGKSIDVASDRRRFSFESDAVAMAQFSDARRETMVINRPSTVPKNMPVIMDEDNIDDDEDEFMPVSSTTFIKPDMNRDVTWDDLYNFENDADGPESQIIYYPPSESDGSDTLASSYQVFNAGINNSGTAKQLRHSLSINSNPDADSESTDPVSLEDMDEDEDSNNSTPSTPLDDMVSKSKTREKFLKETFENLSFTPSLPTDKFLKGLDTMEEEMENTQPTAAINSRQSLSARFLSKANTRGPYGNIPRQDNWFDSVQRRKDDMARNLDESRKMLMAMGWKQESPEADAEDPFADPPTIPTSPPHDTTPKAGRVLSDIDEKKTSLTLNLHNVPEPVASIGSPRTPKTLRRCWSNLDLPKTPIPEVVSEENATKKTTPRKPIQRSGIKASMPNLECVSRNSCANKRSMIPTVKSCSPKSSQRTVTCRASSCSITNKPGKDTATTPTSRKSLSSQVRPRTLPLDRSGGRVTPTDKSTNQKTGRTSVANRKPTPTASSTMTGVDSKLKTSRLSAPIMSKVEIDFEPRRASSGSNLSKAKSNSMHSLTFQEDEQELTPRGTNRKPRSKWSKSNLSSFASVPNLLQPDDDGRISLKCYSDDSSSVDTIKTDPDLNDNVFKKTKSSVRKSNQQSSKSDNSLAANARRSVSASRLSGGSTSRDPSVEEKKPMNRKVGSSAGNLQSASGNKKPKDRDLMPPPPIPNASAKARQERIAKRANDPRRKTTDNSGFSLEEAKDILSGKSIKITEIKEKARRKRSSSSSPKRDRVKSTSSIEKQSSVKNDFVQITDPGVLDATSEIEMTAAEIQRKSAPATNSVSLEASPNDPPERDIPCERDGPRTRSRVSKSATGINKTNVKPKSEPVITNGENSDSARDSGLSTQEDEDCPSPSVKDRIARLNKRVIDTDRQSSVSPCRGPIHSQTASVDSTRKSSVQFNLSSDSSAKSTVTSETSASILAMTNSSVAMETVNVSHDISSPKTANTFQSNSVSESNIDIFSKNTHSVAPAAQELSCSTQSLSPPSGLGTSMDSEGLASNLSPGNHSNGSPRSVADTGLGSDTDLETSQTFKRDQLSGSGGAPALLIDALREQQSLSDRIVSLYAQVQNRQDEESLDAKREINQQLPMLIQSLMDGVGINMPVSTHEDSVTLPRSMLHNIIQGVKNIEEFFDK